jgi:hypothetical protein
MRYLVWGPLGGLTIAVFLFYFNAFGTNVNLSMMVALALVIAGAIAGVMLDKKNPS